MIDAAQSGERVGDVVLVGQDDAHIVLAVGRAVVERRIGQFIECPPDLRPVVQRRQRDGTDRERAILVQFADRHRLFVAQFREGIFQRRAAVADTLAAAVLRAVQMPQRDVIKVREDRGVDVVRSADGNLFGIGPGGARHELVRDEDVSMRRVDVHRADRRGNCTGVGVDLLVCKVRAHLRGLEERQQPDLHALDREGRDLAAVHGRDMDAAQVEQPRAERQPPGRIVVAADEEDLRAAPRQLNEETVEQVDRLGIRDGFVVDVAGNQHGVRFFVVDDSENLLQDMLLLLQHRHFIDTFSDM